jgi:hypothetical protein
MSSTALDIITGGLLNINAFAVAQPLSSADANAGLNDLNDLVDSLSNDEAFVYTQQETIFTWIAGQFQYTVGNPIGGTFVGTVTAGSPTITGVTSIPALLVANTTPGLGSTLTDTGAAIPVGSNLFPAATTVLSFNAGAQTVTMSQNALLTPAINPDTITYTVPGNIPMNRPLRFRSGFSRAATSSIANLDYTFTFTDFDNYKRELLKNVQGPWPYIAAYQPTFPYGNLYVYPAPGSSYTAHIFSDLILSEFASTTAVYSLPQGYTRALKKLLALEMAPRYGKTPSPQLISQAKEAKELLKGTNSQPVRVLQYDTAISRSATKDASWIQTGGFT